MLSREEGLNPVWDMKLSQLVTRVYHRLLGGDKIEMEQKAERHSLYPVPISGTIQ